jgi:hypothetical protein
VKAASNNQEEFEYLTNKTLYDNLLSMTTLSGSEAQIERDITRTFPTTEPFISGLQGQPQLRRVLSAFSKYDSSLGYV